MGSSPISRAGPLASPAAAAAAATLLPGVSTVVLDEPSEDSICFDDGFLRSIIVSNESSEGSIISSDGKECSLKTGKVVTRPVSDCDGRGQNLGVGRGCEERQWFRVSRGQGLQDKSDAQPGRAERSWGKPPWVQLGASHGEKNLQTPDLPAYSPRFTLPVWPDYAPVAVRNSQPINSVELMGPEWPPWQAGTWQVH